jgi:4-amino-4-deoxy-L-arabinose transferase-like glycosyltransferase
VSTDTRRIGAIVLLALLVRLLLAAVLGDRFYFADETTYVDAARRLLSGEGFGPDYTRVPGYPVLLALLAGPWPQSVLWIRLGQAALAAAGTGLTFALTDRLVGRTAALAAAAMYALDPLLAVAAGLLYPEATAALVLAATALVAIDAVRRNSTSLAALAGALLGILAQFRPVALVLVPVTAAWISFAAPATPARRLSHVAIVLLACLLVLAPWTYRNYQLWGRIVPVSLAGTGGAGISRTAAEQRGVGAALAAQAWSDPWRVARRMGREFTHFWELTPERLQTDDPARRDSLHRADPRLPNTPLAPPSLRNAVAATASGAELLLALGGLVVMWRRRRRETVFLAGIILTFGLGHSLFVGKMRYRITVMPLVLVLAGAGVATLGPALAKRAGRVMIPRKVESDGT